MQADRLVEVLDGVEHRLLRRAIPRPVDLGQRIIVSDASLLTGIAVQRVLPPRVEVVQHDNGELLEALGAGSHTLGELEQLTRIIHSEVLRVALQCGESVETGEPIA